MNNSNPSAYKLFTKDKVVKDSIKKNHPEFQLESGKWDGKLFISEQARMWNKEMTPEEKKPFEILSNQHSKVIAVEDKKITEKELVTEKPKRAMSAYFHFLHDKYNRIQFTKDMYLELIKTAHEVESISTEKYEEFIAFNFEELSKQDKETLKEADIKVSPTKLTSHISIIWKSMSPEEQSPYKEKSSLQAEELLKNPIMVVKTVKTKHTTPKSEKCSTSDIDNSRLISLEDEVKFLKLQNTDLARKFDALEQRFYQLEKTNISSQLDDDDDE